MIVHFIRHAQAINRSESLADDHRFLTCRGRKRFRKVAGILRRLEIDPEYIFASPKIRAVQTADILAEKLVFSGDIIITPLLADFSIKALQDLLHTYPLPSEIALVGHEPDFSDVIGQLLQKPLAPLAKGAVVTVNISPKKARLTASLIGIITGGGNHISDRSKAIERLQIGTRELSEESES
jgi:phosphohistidine phosphatase